MSGGPIGTRTSDGARSLPSATAQTSGASLYFRVLGYLRPYLLVLAGLIMASFAFAALDTFVIVLLVPFVKALFSTTGIEFDVAGEQVQWLLENTIGRFIQDSTPALEALTVVTIAVLVTVLLKNVFDYLQTYLVVVIEQSVARDLRNEVYGHLLDLDLRFFGRTRAGQIITRLTSDTDVLRTLVTRNIAKFGTSVLQIAIALFIMLVTSWRLTIIACVVLPLTFFIWRRLLAPLRRGDRRILDIGGDVTSHLQETVTGIRQVKAGAAEPFERDRFRRITQRHLKAFVRTERVRALASPLSETLGAIGTVLILWYGGRMVLVDGSINPEDFILFIALSLKLYAPAKWMSRFPSMIQPGLSAAERVFEFLDMSVRMTDPPDARMFTGFEDAMRFEGVGFHYVEGEPVLHDVDFEVRPGEVVALVGPSGAGKTTLVDLAARFYDPTEGRITIDGVDLRQFSVRSFRKRLGIVAQETMLFHDTVRANIAYALPDATDADIERAARAANAHEFVERLPNGYDTVLGERATRLSGGQRQRIAIARAILRDPTILILDEATSALDSESERLVQDAIEHMVSGRTVFVIAHRLSTIRNASLILVLADGRIVQRGTHHELAARPGLYRHLYDLQFGEAGTAMSVPEPPHVG